MATYLFRQGLDYGPRQGTLGLLYHMTEGSGGYGDVQYLMQRPGESLVAWRTRVRGVSVNAVCIDDGTVYQMLPWASASGSLNPADRAGEYGYYGGSVLREVLGAGWTDPNTWLVSMEIAGKRADGPNDAQVRGAIAWGLDMRSLFPTLRGALGHHDQSPKECPGLTPAMKAIFDGVGGHGLWPTEQEDDMRFVVMGGWEGMLLPVKQGDKWLYLDGSPGGTFAADAQLEIIGKADAMNGRWMVEIGTGTPYPTDDVTRRTGVLVLSATTPLPKPVVPAPSCDDAIAAALERAAERAATAVRTAP